MRKTLYTFFIGLVCLQAYSQHVTITPNGITPVLSGNYPRLTYEAIRALPSPNAGDIAYDTSFKCLRVYTGNEWICSHQNISELVPNASAIVAAGGTEWDLVKDMAVASNGDVFITGFYTGAATFGNTSVTSQANMTTFIAKYTKDGTFQWVRSVSGVSSSSGQSIAVDASGNVYASGYFTGTTNFGTTSITSAGSYDVYLVKYNASGTLQWVRSAGGTGTEIGRKIVINSGGDIFLAGTYSNTATFGTSSITSKGNQDVFIARYNSSGALQWVISLGGTGLDSVGDITFDYNSNLYITGGFAGTATFGTTTRTSAGGDDIYIAKFNPTTLTWVWVTRMGGTGNDVGIGLGIDNISNLFVTGTYTGTAYFDTVAKTSLGETDVFLIKFDNSGAFTWVESAGGPSYDNVSSIAVDFRNNVYLTGEFWKMISVGPYSKGSRAGNDAFVAAYRTNGNVQWLQTFGSISQDEGVRVRVDSNFNLYMAGNYTNTVKFGNTSITAKGSNDFFVIRFDQ